MRIISKFHDFYDYLQDPTDTIIFDRRRAFMLTKELFCDNLDRYDPSAFRFVLLQAGATYWLFLATITKDRDFGGNVIKDYDLELLHSWKNYIKPLRLVHITTVVFNYEYKQLLKEHYRGDYIVERIRANVSKLTDAIDHDDVEYGRVISKHTVYKDHKGSFTKEIFDIPILAPCGVSICIDPATMFYAIEEYFSIKKSESEKTVADGTTELDKISAHGFDVKTSFRMG